MTNTTPVDLSDGLKKAVFDYQEGDYFACETNLLDLHNQDLHNQKILNLLCVLYKKMERFECALYYCEKMISNDPSIYEAWCNKAIYLNDLFRYAEAKDAITKAKEINPNRNEVRIILMDILISEDAEKNKNISNPENTQSYLDTRDYSVSVIRDYPQNIPVRQKVGLYFKKLKLWSKAIVILERLVDAEIAPHLLECLYEKNDNQSEVIKFLNVINRTEPSNINLAKVSDFICSQYEILNPYNFAPQALKLIKKQSVESFLKDNSFFNIKNIEYKNITLSKNNDNFDKVFSFKLINKNNDNKFIPAAIYNMIEKSFEDYFPKDFNELAIFNDWPEKANLTISIANSSEAFKTVNGSWISAVLFSNKNNNYYKKLQKVNFDYNIPNMTVKSKKVRKESFKINNNDLIIFPSTLVPKFSESEGLDYFIINFLPIIKS